MKAERKGKATYMEKINRHVLPGFAYGDVPDPFKIYRDKDCGKVCRIHRRRGKAAVCNISTAAHDRTYRCVEKRAQGNSVISALKSSMTHRKKR